MTSYLLIGFYYRKPSAARAAQKAFWVTKFADMGFLVGLLVLFVASGSFGWDAKLAPGVATAVTLLFFLAVVGKSAQFPLHVWLPDAMEGPTPVSALLHAATMVAAGVFLVVRADPLFAQAPDTRTLMLGHRRRPPPSSPRASRSCRPTSRRSSRTPRARSSAT